MDAVRIQVLVKVPGLELEMAKLMEDMIGDLTAVPEPIEIKLYSDDGELLATLAEKVAHELEKISGVVDINNGVIPAGDALNIRVLRDRAGLDGLSAEDVNLALNNYLSGATPTQIQEGVKMINVRVWIPESERSSINALNNLRIRAPDGHLVPLKRIAEITTETGQAQIKRDNLKRMVAVTARISGRDMGSTIADIIKVLDQPEMLPREVYYVLGGLYEQQQIAFKGMCRCLSVRCRTGFCVVTVPVRVFSGGFSDDIYDINFRSGSIYRLMAHAYRIKYHGNHGHDDGDWYRHRSGHFLLLGI